MAHLEKVRDLKNRLRLASKAEGEQLNVEHLTALADKLAGPIDGLERHAARSRALGLALSEVSFEAAESALKALREEFSKRPEDVGQGSLFADCLAAIVEVHKEIDAEVAAAWTEMRVGILRQAPESLLDFWDSVPELRSEAQGVRRQITNLRASETAPGRPETLEGLAASARSIQESLAKLQEFKAPDCVRKFLRDAARSRGAAWALLTDEVRDWLSENDMLDGLRVTLG